MSNEEACMGWAIEWLGLVVRWFHMMMGVAWIGASFYFIWLNNTVRPPEEDIQEGVAGKLWAIHGGAFYEVTKYSGAPSRLPKVLHWFKWEAYLTWITGFILVVLHFWLNAATMMVSQDIGLSPLHAVGVGVGSLVGGWLVYDGLCRTPLKDKGELLAGLLLAFLVASSYGLFQLLPPRAAYLHMGAMVGTWMAANVFFVIIPGQKAMVDAMIAGKPPPLERGKAGSLRSLHNNYLTLPVLFVMISGHFPQTWGHPYGWLILIGLGLCGALYRHWVNLDERGQHKPWIPAAAALGLLVLGVLTRPAPAVALEPGAEHVRLAQVQQIVANRCLSCHAEEPTQAGVATAPKGVMFHEPDQLRAVGPQIYQQVVAAKSMPLGNLTGMTEEEREVIGRWCQQEGFGE